jgi:hypothetical protein
MKQQQYFAAWMMVAAALIAGMTCSAAAHAAPIAVVTDAQGRSLLQGAAPARPLVMLAEIDGDARVQLDDKARLVVLYYSTGEEFSLRGPALVLFKPAAPEALSGNPPEKQSGKNKTDSGIRIKPGGVTQAGVRMRITPEGPKLKLLGLSDTVTLEARPEFRWSALEPGLNYVFRLSDDTGRVLHETKGTGNSLNLPANLQLKPDALYTWEVSTRLRNGMRYTSAGDFSIANAALRAQVDRTRPADSAAVSEKVFFALWLEQVDLKDEARKYWRMARAQRPDDARLKALAGE